MFARTIQFRVRPEMRPILCEQYESQVLTNLQEISACRSACLLKSQLRDDELLSLAIWADRQAADDFAAGPAFRRVMGQLAPFLADAAGWQVKLTEDLQLRSTPAREEPLVHGYTVALQQVLKESCSGNPSAMNVRRLSLLLRPGQEAEFKHIYVQRIIPALERTRGCCRAFLLEGVSQPPEMASFTWWERPQDIRRYEETGEFSLLLDLIVHTLSGLSRWKMELQKEFAAQVRTSEDVTVTLYQPVCGFDRDAPAAKRNHP